jgi:hypothetical protein
MEASEAGTSRSNEKRMDMAIPIILFLDIDGVLHPLHRHLPRGATLDDFGARVDEDLLHDTDPNYVGGIVQGEFTSECMANLRDLVKASGCRVVLSSTWRETSYQVLVSALLCLLSCVCSLVVASVLCSKFPVLYSLLSECRVVLSSVWRETGHQVL